MRPPFPIVGIVWKDHWSHGGWASKEQALNPAKDAHLCYTVGWLIEETDDVLRVAPSLTTDTEQPYGDPNTIFKRLIVDIVHLSPEPVAGVVA